jgi:oligopeptidase B
VHTVWAAGNVEFDTHVLRFGYASPVTPATVYDEDIETGERVLRKRQPVLGDFDSAGYVASRQWATAPDGARIPISLVHRRDTPLDGTAPGVLYGYGAYEISTDPGFSVARLSLLDRGFVFAIAHVRGGGELGRRWYLDGKLANKRNTFSDFVVCAEHLVQNGTVARGRLVARGGSAGGLLMGAVLNARPDLFAAVVAEVPFVDVVTTMLDDTLPLTAIEWEEWGNPAEPGAFADIVAYSPYDNVGPARYPDVLVTAGLNDPRVGFWEPAKWVAKLRTQAEPGSGRLLLKTELGAGHGGPSGRYDAWRDEAFVLAFVVTATGAPEAPR